MRSIHLRCYACGIILAQRRMGWRGPELQPGMCLAIEPMFTLGTGDVYVEADGWTVATVDDALAAHFEHTIAITANGPEILTQV